MTTRERDISPHGVGVRADNARAYLMVAELVRDDDTLRVGNSVVGSLAVLAGIAAADAISGHVLGLRAAGEDHQQAIGLLERATSPSSKSRASLRRLVSSKTATQYSPEIVGAAKAKQLLTAARQLVREMESILRS